MKQKSAIRESVQASKEFAGEIPNSQAHVMIEIEGRFAGSFSKLESGQSCFGFDPSAPRLKHASDFALVLMEALKEQDDVGADYVLGYEYLEDTNVEARLRITLKPNGVVQTSRARAKALVQSVVAQISCNADLYSSGPRELTEDDAEIATRAAEKFLSAHSGKSAQRSMKLVVDGEDLAVVHGHWVTVQKEDIRSEVETVIVYFDGYRIRSRTAFFQTHQRPSKLLETYFDEQQHGQFLASLYGERAKPLQVRLRTEWHGGKARLHVEDIGFADVNEPLLLTHYPDSVKLP